ncbi:MAG: exodeoxyribonuclease VII large subunit [Gemmatimonadetes bacterium]|nr:exodeoxyribonuclease VII large subunit [Gemmatimonadota bacterium]
MSVSALPALARETLERAIPSLWVAGEVAGWKRYGSSGHCYFSLRDAHAQIRCVMFRSDAQRLPADPDEGMQVRVLGRLTLYDRKGDVQFVVRELEARAAGGLWRVAFEKLRAQLEAEGLLAAARKRPLPDFPETVGVVTSPAGAVLQDILHVIRRRAPWVRVVLSPAPVQGDGAAREIGRALARLGAVAGIDVIIVGRGGGGVEDLWAFNEEPVARAIAACPVPVISAVGHETDVTIADLVADVRAPTPSAAAERAVPDGLALAAGLRVAEGRLRGALLRGVTERRDHLAQLAEGLEDALRDWIVRTRERVARLAHTLEALSPLGILARGYAVAQTAGGRVVRSCRELPGGTPFRLRLGDGSVQARSEGALEADHE